MVTRDELAAAFHSKPHERAALMDRISLAIENGDYNGRPRVLAFARAALRFVVGYRHVHGRPCLLAREGWTSPIHVSPGYVSVDPCPECGVIHHDRGARRARAPRVR